MFQKTANYYKSQILQDPIIWFRRELFILSYLSVIEIASKCISIDKKILNSYIENNLLNVGIPMDSKLNIKKGVDLFIEEIKKVGIKYDLEQIEIVPKYMTNMIKLIERIIKSSKYMQQNLNINENLNRIITKNNEKHISESLDEKYYRNVSEINTLLLRILHNDSILPDFSLFI